MGKTKTYASLQRKMHEPTERDLRIAEMRKSMTLEEIGAVEGVTRERIRQLLVKSGLNDHPDYQYSRECDECGERVQWGERRAHRRAEARVGGPSTYSHQTIEQQLKAEAIVADYLAGMRLFDISLKYLTETGRPATYSMIYRYLKRAGIQPDRGGGAYQRTTESRKRMSDAQLARWYKKESAPRRGWRANDE